MSIVLLESFEGNTKWNTGTTQVGTFVRTGNQSKTISSNSALWPVPAADQHATFIVGFAIKLGGIGTGVGNYPIFQLYSGGVIIGKLELMYPTTNGPYGLRYVRTPGGDTVLATTPAGIIDSGSASWYYIELKVFLHATLGTVEIRTNEVVRATATNVDTRSTGGSTFSHIFLAGVSTGGGIDDFYLCNGAGSAPTNDFLGDTTIHKILPNGNGDLSLWVGSDGNSVDNYLLVDDPPPVSTADYVESGVLLATDLYNFENLPAGVSGRQVFGLERWSFAKTTALPNTMAQVTKLGVIEVEGPTETMTVTDTWYVHRQETKPGGGAWTTADVDAAQHGQRVKS